MPEAWLTMAGPTLAGWPIGMLLVASAIMAAGAMMQAALGIGLALFVVPLLAVLDPAFVPGPVLAASLVLVIGMAWRERAAIDARPLGVALGGLAIGTVLAVLAIAALGDRDPGRIFGAVILIAVAASIAAPRIRPTTGACIAGGTASGLMGTMAGIHGPPVALLFQDADPPRIRATLGAFFAVGYVASLGALALAGRFGSEEIRLGLLLVPGTLAGWAMAPWAARRLNRERMRIGILVVSALSGLALLVG